MRFSLQAATAGAFAVALVMLAGTARTAAQEEAPAPAGAPAAAQPAGDPATEQELFKQQVSYALGLNVGRDLKSDGIPIDPASFAAGISDVFSGAQPKLTDTQIRALMMRLQQELAARAQAAGTRNLQAGQAFLAANATKEGIQTTASGLQYRIVRPGVGATPTLADKVSCNYEGTLIDGTVFDSSYKRGRPAQFPVSGVISGWTEALQLMKVGAKWELFIPSDLAYGPNGPPSIGPNSTLIFTIELLDVVK